MSSPSPSLLFPLAAFPCTIIPYLLVNKANKDSPSKPFYLFLVIVATLYAARGSYLAFFDAAFLPSTASPLYRNLSSGGYAVQALGIGMVAVVGWQVWWKGVKERRVKLKVEGLVETKDERTEGEGEKEKEVGEVSV